MDGASTEPAGALSFCVSDNHVLFNLAGDINVQARLIDGAWPKSPTDVVTALSKGAKYKTLTSEIEKAVLRVLPLCADTRAPVIVFDETTIRTPTAEVMSEVTGFKNLGKCKFRAEPLLQVLHAATHADFAKFPHVPWQNVETKLHGVIVGML